MNDPDHDSDFSCFIDLVLVVMIIIAFVLGWFLLRR